jgi:hypothetical protein
VVVIHANPRLQHQQDFALALAQGFKRNGLSSRITANKHLPGDLHVVIGPWYALEENKHHRILYADRCFYGDSRWTISLGWLENGQRDFMNLGMAASKGSLPLMRPRKDGRRRAVVLGDYGCDMQHEVLKARVDYDEVMFRPHPAERPSEWTLERTLEWADVAIGYGSTALVDALLWGLEVKTLDTNHVCHGVTDRTSWLTDLSWAQWTHSECASGEFWRHLNAGWTVTTQADTAK